jgi:LPXTG-site transpeptidase (sortase) family protein
MFPRGTIYQQGFPAHGEKSLHPSFWLHLGYDLARGLGAGLIGFAVIYLLFTFTPLIKEELAYRAGKRQLTADVNFAAAQQKEAVQAEAESLGVDSYFSIVIPKLGAKSKIIANVDAADRQAYLEALSQGVAHARGTYFPGQNGKIFLFAHSTDSPLNFARYNAVFYLLGKLEKGDQIIIFFADKKYEYEVTEKKVVAAKDTNWLTSPTYGEELILQTCDPPGTSWRRLLILAKPVSGR